MICNNCYKRDGKLVQQFVAVCHGVEPFVFRYYMCRWCLSANNRGRKKIKYGYIDYKTDSQMMDGLRPPATDGD